MQLERIVFKRPAALQISQFRSRVERGLNTSEKLRLVRRQVTCQCVALRSTRAPVDRRLLP